MQQDVWPRRDHQRPQKWQLMFTRCGIGGLTLDTESWDSSEHPERALITLICYRLEWKTTSGRLKQASLTKWTCVRLLLWPARHLLWIICPTDCHGDGSMVSSWHQPCPRRGLAGTGRERRQLPSARQWICARSVCIVLVVSTHTHILMPRMKHDGISVLQLACF